MQWIRFLFPISVFLLGPDNGLKEFGIQLLSGLRKDLSLENVMDVESWEIGSYNIIIGGPS